MAPPKPSLFERVTGKALSPSGSGTQRGHNRSPASSPRPNPSPVVASGSGGSRGSASGRQSSPFVFGSGDRYLHSQDTRIGDNDDSEEWGGISGADSGGEEPGDSDGDDDGVDDSEGSSPVQPRGRPRISKAQRYELRSAGAIAVPNSNVDFDDDDFDFDEDDGTDPDGNALTHFSPIPRAISYTPHRDQFPGNVLAPNQRYTVAFDPVAIEAIRSKERLDEALRYFTGEPKNLGNLQQIYLVLYTLLHNVASNHVVRGHLEMLVDVGGKQSESPNWPNHAPIYRNTDVENALTRAGIVSGEPLFYPYTLSAMLGHVSRGAVRRSAQCTDCATGKGPYRDCCQVYGKFYWGGRVLLWQGACSNCRFRGRHNNEITQRRKGCSLMNPNLPMFLPPEQELPLLVPDGAPGGLDEEEILDQDDE